MLVLCVLLVLWNDDLWLNKEPLDFIEHFSGKEVLINQVQRAGFRVASVDIIHSRGMDILKPSGFGTFLVSALMGKESGYLDWLGILCSSWVDVSRGSTRRTWCNPMGHTEFPSVARGNLMASRCALLCLVIVATGGNFIVEQPASSLLFRHDRMRWLCQRLRVYKVALWMGQFNSKTPKRTMLWSSTSIVSLFLNKRFSLKQYRAAAKKKNSVIKPVRRYKNANGCACWTGTTQLKDTQTYPMGLGKRLVKLLALLKMTVPPVEVRGHGDAVEMFRNADYEGDDCSDAELRQVVYYLRGCRGLKIPQRWRPLLPKVI
ncbi:unnamed protein product [Symbiodinium sp. CCMP2592]|nr:unnamed protein product [Symbiodinium sp. CCMP2592]